MKGRILLWVGVALLGHLQAAPKYVGSAVCRPCHPNVAVDFFKNPHFKSVAAGDQAPEKTGCESCHGPASDHVAARGGKSTIVAFSVLKPEAALNNCLQCHAESIGRMAIRRSSHSLNGVACNNCHSIHKPKTIKHLLANEQREVCYGCHNNVRAQFNLPFKHRVNEGFMTCSDCHNPHGGQAPNWRAGARPRMMEHAQGNEQPCMKCHVDKRGPFAFEHAAVRVDGCESCHAPHGSANARLMKRPAVVTLCLECHNGAESFGRQADGVALTPRFHNMADPRYRNCTTCHVRIHGSNGDPRFLR